MMSIAFEAMCYAREAHAGQRRKYTNAPYFDHLAEVVGISMSVGWHHVSIHPDAAMAVAWLHDAVEDQGKTLGEIHGLFGDKVAEGVALLSDLETGNRAARKAASRARLAAAPGWVQTIKLADLISNTHSIVEHNPSFARVYLAEKIELLKVMRRGDPRLHRMAEQIARAGMLKIGSGLG